MSQARAIRGPAEISEARCDSAGLDDASWDGFEFLEWLRTSPPSGPFGSVMGTVLVNIPEHMRAPASGRQCVPGPTD